MPPHQMHLKLCTFGAHKCFPKKLSSPPQGGQTMEMEEPCSTPPPAPEESANSNGARRPARRVPRGPSLFLGFPVFFSPPQTFFRPLCPLPRVGVFPLKAVPAWLALARVRFSLSICVESSLGWLLKVSGDGGVIKLFLFFPSGGIGIIVDSFFFWGVEVGLGFCWGVRWTCVFLGASTERPLVIYSGVVLGQYDK